MNLDAYLDRENITDQLFAKAIGTKPFAVFRYRNKKRLPNRQIIKRIFEATNGVVTPNDFYDLSPPNKQNL